MCESISPVWVQWLRSPYHRWPRMMENGGWAWGHLAMPLPLGLALPSEGTRGCCFPNAAGGP